MNRERNPISSQAIHGAILLFALVAVAICLPEIGWPWYMFVPLAAYFGLVLLVPSLRRSMPKIKSGRLDVWACGVAAAFALASSGGLLSFQAAFQPDVAPLAARLPLTWFETPLLAGMCFSLGNAVLEELIFRWSLYEAFSAEWGEGLAIAITAIIFGLGHIDGYPPGWMGALAAGGYGVGLGMLRWWTGGLALCIACHICADATIFVIVIGNHG